MDELDAPAAEPAGYVLSSLRFVIPPASCRPEETHFQTVPQVAIRSRMTRRSTPGRLSEKFATPDLRTLSYNPRASMARAGGMMPCVNRAINILAHVAASTQLSKLRLTRGTRREG